MSDKKFILRTKPLAGNSNFIKRSISKNNNDESVVKSMENDFRKLGVLEDLAASKKTIIGKYKELTKRNQEISDVKNQLISRYKNLIELDNKLSDKFNVLINDEDEFVASSPNTTDNYSEKIKKKIKRTDKKHSGISSIFGQKNNEDDDSDFNQVKTITNNYQEKITNFTKQLSKIQSGIDKETHDSEEIITQSESIQKKLDAMNRKLDAAALNDKKIFDILKLVMDWANSFHNAESKLFSSTSTFINETQKLKHDMTHLNNILLRIDERDHDYFNLLKKIDFIVNQVEESKKVHENYSLESKEELNEIVSKIDQINKAEVIQMKKSEEILEKEKLLEEDHRRIDTKLKSLEQKESTIDHMLGRLDKDFKKIKKETEVIAENQELASEITSFNNTPETKSNKNFPIVNASMENSFFVPDHNISLDVGESKQPKTTPTHKDTNPIDRSLVLPNRTIRARIHMLLDDTNSLIKNKDLKNIKKKLHEIKYYYDMLENNDPYKSEVYNKVHSIKSVISR